MTFHVTVKVDSQGFVTFMPEFMLDASSEERAETLAVALYRAQCPDATNVTASITRPIQHVYTEKEIEELIKELGR